MTDTVISVAFLGYLDTWAASAGSRNVPEAEKATMCLSAETQERLRLTGSYIYSTHSYLHNSISFQQCTLL